MSEVILRAENISKEYQLGLIGASSLRQDLQALFSRKNKAQSVTGDQHIWALKDINFDLHAGEVIGIVGSNGSGKSTLLKILSRIARPTTGTVRWKGNISSLLEIGTGFHAELTGRENIFLNGQTLGLNRKQVSDRFDEIVDFSGIERFLDTPVKRYSSGMYVRLAFSVAAHLKSDILIIDEVLAVGDVEFQLKCIAKMKEISRVERTAILFVSHDMQNVRNLCTTGIHLEKGLMKLTGNPADVIASYLNVNVNIPKHNYTSPQTAPGNSSIKIKKVELSAKPETGPGPLNFRSEITIRFEFWYTRLDNLQLSTSIMLYNELGQCVFDLSSAAREMENGLIKGAFTLPEKFLNDGHYLVCIAFVGDHNKLLFDFPDCLNFHILDTEKNLTWYGNRAGIVHPAFPIHLQHQTETDGNI